MVTGFQGQASKRESVYYAEAVSPFIVLASEVMQHRVHRTLLVQVVTKTFLVLRWGGIDSNLLVEEWQIMDETMEPEILL